MKYERIAVHPIPCAIGSVIGGVDLTHLEAETYAEIYRAFLEHLVIFFRDQVLPAGQRIAFARRFGEIGTYPFVEGMAAYPEIVEVSKEPAVKENFGGICIPIPPIWRRRP